MSATPQSQLILEQLVAWLSGIRQSAGYHTDAGLDVRTEQQRGEAPLKDCLYVLDESAIWQSAANGQPRGLWTQSLTIEGMVYDDGSGRLHSRQLLSDIHRALRRRPTEWPAGTGVTALRETTRTIEPRPHNSDWLTPTVIVDIDYVDHEVTP